MMVASLDESAAADWDRFVDRCPQATFFHRAGWKDVIETAFGHRPHYLYARENGRILGVLPLARIRSRLFGDALISTPFAVYGGVAADTEEAHTALTEAACELAERLRVDYLEMRNIECRRERWPSKDLYVTFRKRLDPDPEANLRLIPRKQRAMVRKGIEAGLVSEEDETVDRLYAAYSESVRNLGTPVPAKRYFRLLKRIFGKDCRVLTVTKDRRVIASVLSFYFRDQVLPYYGGGTSEARDCKGNDFMYWELMRRSALAGVRVFDYGRSKRGTGSYDFKRNWGFEPEPLHYEYHLVRARDVPEVNPLNPKYRLLVGLWRRLPLAVSRAIGPLVAKDLG
jgi:FemAB-related protein (PEP-CTERM system-associated)